MCAKPPSTPSQKERTAPAPGSDAILQRSEQLRARRSRPCTRLLLAWLRSALASRVQYLPHVGFTRQSHVALAAHAAPLLDACPTGGNLCPSHQQSWSFFSPLAWQQLVEAALCGLCRGACVRGGAAGSAAPPRSTRWSGWEC
eukprot:scaffold6638_cov76-Phaeocystis_antarctica.AAC.8